MHGLQSHPCGLEEHWQLETFWPEGVLPQVQVLPHWHEEPQPQAEVSLVCVQGHYVRGEKAFKSAYMWRAVVVITMVIISSILTAIVLSVELLKNLSQKKVCVVIWLLVKLGSDGNWQNWMSHDGFIYIFFFQSGTVYFLVCVHARNRLNTCAWGILAKAHEKIS